MMLFLLLFVSIHLCNVEGLICLNCHGIQQPRHCRSVGKCVGNDMYCKMERVLDTHGYPVFNLGCGSNSACTNRTLDSRTSCQECCSSDLCNSKGCGEPGYPVNGEQICYDCPMTIGDRPCLDITFCQQDEVCRFQRRVEFGDTLYVRGCSDKNSCRSGHEVPIVGKRSVTSRDLQYEHDHCCPTDLCNEGLLPIENNTSPQQTNNTIPASDCYDVLHRLGHNVSAIYPIVLPISGRKINVFCDMVTDGGGWTVLQHRMSADVDFNRNMSEYVKGFGNMTGLFDFWLGLENMYELTSNRTNTLYIKLLAADGTRFHSSYDDFLLSPGPSYVLNVGTRHGNNTAGSQDLSYNNGFPFSTFDVDNDRTESNCAKLTHGAWWHRYCSSYLFLNGEFLKPGTISITGMHHQGFHHLESLKESTIMCRRK